MERPVSPPGVDLIEMKKADSLYRAAAGRLSSLFSREEVRYIRNGRHPQERLARLLTAKEAVFKATPSQTTGVIPFRSIRVLQAGRIRRRLDDPRTKLVVRREGAYVIAHCGPCVLS